MMTKDRESFDAIVIGGSYAGLAAAMALGRAMRRVLVIDSGQPCNRQTPHSHNFITHDGRAPEEIAALARQQVQMYGTVRFVDGLAQDGFRTESGFAIETESNGTFAARKLVFATGIRDLLPGIPGFAECWGITALHCPYCHGYEVRDKPTGILGNGAYGFEFSGLIANWTKDLALFTDGASTLTAEQALKLKVHGIEVVETSIECLEQVEGKIQSVVTTDGKTWPLEALYSRPPFEQHCRIPQTLGCEMTEQGYLKIDALQKTSVSGIFACGDNATSMRTVANAVAMGTTAGMIANRELSMEDFELAAG